MSTIKSLWAAVQGSPEFMRRVNGWLTIIRIVMIPVSVATGWVHSVTYISALSLWALVSGHWSAWQAARVEVEQQREVAEREADPPEERMVDLLIERTNLVESAAADGSAPVHRGTPGGAAHPLEDTS